MFGDCALALNYPLLNPSLFVSSSFPSDPPGWLVCCCATSAHSLQEMTDADEGRKTPFSVRGSKIHHVFPQTLTKSSVIRDESAPHGYSELQD